MPKPIQPKQQRQKVLVNPRHSRVGHSFSVVASQVCRLIHQIIQCVRSIHSHFQVVVLQLSQSTIVHYSYIVELLLFFILVTSIVN